MDNQDIKVTKSIYLGVDVSCFLVCLFFIYCFIINLTVAFLSSLSLLLQKARHRDSERAAEALTNPHWLYILESGRSSLEGCSILYR